MSACVRKRSSYRFCDDQIIDKKNSNNEEEKNFDLLVPKRALITMATPIIDRRLVLMLKSENEDETRKRFIEDQRIFSIVLFSIDEILEHHITTNTCQLFDKIVHKRTHPFVKKDVEKKRKSPLDRFIFVS